MISVEEALEILLSNLPERKMERVPFQEALGRVLAEELVATCDIPPFNRSSMDGFAVRAVDVKNPPVELDVIGESRAGGGIPPGLKAGEAVAIMTGAPVPEGADAVEVIEQCELVAGGKKIRVLRPVQSKDNIAPQASEAKAGSVAITAGHRVGPAEIAVMATFGYSRVNVYGQPSVAIFATGDELVEVDATPQPDQIRNSNAYCLASQLRLMGLRADYLGIVRDDREELRRAMLAGLERDVLIITGGVSMGEYDFVRDVFQDLELEILFSKVAIKPGKPTVFARKGNKLVFGLPGNPISALITFECFVRPALGRLCGMTAPELPRMKGELQADMRQSPGRTAFMPAWVTWQDDGWKVEPLKWKSSADIIGFTGANATFIFPKNRDLLRRGEIVEIMLLPDFFVRQK
ncbi:MAG TPA: gephyrin-like molybdotransferase Glp [Acidobacteriota bacterium]|nr:gephyrin-like molybdotransferase Glp [Acidobacteriota bacterium]